MKIYTKNGDKGETSLLGSKRVKKYDINIEAYGEVDELNAHIGLLRDYLANKEHHFYRQCDIFLTIIQNNLFEIGSALADETNEKFQFTNTHEIEKIENRIDILESDLPELKNFILPYGNGYYEISQCHIIRSICRRVERKVVYLNDEQPYYDIIVQYLNRLSDYFFVLARYLTYTNNTTENLWNG